MYSTQFLPLLIRHFKFSHLIASVPYEFDPTSGKVTVMKSLRRLRVTQIQTLVTSIYLLVLLYHYLFDNVSILIR